MKIDMTACLFKFNFSGKFQLQRNYSGKVLTIHHIHFLSIGLELLRLRLMLGVL